jgi:hypothetical protein
MDAPVQSKDENNKMRKFGKRTFWLQALGCAHSKPHWPIDQAGATGSQRCRSAEWRGGARR